jgi:hypothetical protein
MLDLTEDVGADRLLALWSKAPTPADAMRLTETKIAKVLAAHHIRQIRTMPWPSCIGLR